jgi:hypothetical protein
MALSMDSCAHRIELWIQVRVQFDLEDKLDEQNTLHSQPTLAPEPVGPRISDRGVHGGA